ncbi:MAG: Rieske 2Fe-2S domain-containing protein [Synechococcaceae cyanobacterium]|nr:Rieske 2Fe-2S domain-containing protein [Synechococcaceae cyanobacterium]
MTPPPDPFDYGAAWYPLTPLEDLEPGRPTPVELLGRRYVIWKPASGAYRVFLDLCPHRLAPLSEGRLDASGERLMCSYHGWCFDAEGRCRRIPQASPAEPAERRAGQLAATALPVREAVGLLWLWPEATSAARAEATPLPLSPFASEQDGFRCSSLIRELPYDWTTLVENVADPAHVPFAHHGVQGWRERAVPIPMRMVCESRERLEAMIPSRAIASGTRIVFRPPCLLEYQFSFPGPRRMGLITYCLPVAPGRSRVVALFSRDWTPGWREWRPRWWDHLSNRNEVLDGDLVLLDRQERERRRRAAGPPEASDWRRDYRLPTSADRLVIAFLHWLERHGAPPWPQLMPGVQPPATGGPEPAPAQLLDRHAQHTRHCASCRRALALTRRGQLVAVLLAFAALAAAALLPEGLRFSLGVALVLLAALALTLAAALRWWLEPAFRFRPYDHTRR